MKLVIDTALWYFVLDVAAVSIRVTLCRFGDFEHLGHLEEAHILVNARHGVRRCGLEDDVVMMVMMVMMR